MDAESAQAAAATQTKVNQACSDASFLRQAAVVMWGFLGLSFIPFLPLVGYGFLITLVAVIFLFGRWQWRYGKLHSKDADFAKARGAKNLGLILWIAALPVGFVVRPLVWAVIGSLLP